MPPLFFTDPIIGGDEGLRWTTLPLHIFTSRSIGARLSHLEDETSLRSQPEPTWLHLHHLLNRSSFRVSATLGCRTAQEHLRTASGWLPSAAFPHENHEYHECGKWPLAWAACPACSSTNPLQQPSASTSMSRAPPESSQCPAELAPGTLEDLFAA